MPRPISDSRLRALKALVKHDDDILGLIARIELTDALLSAAKKSTSGYILDEAGAAKDPRSVVMNFPTPQEADEFLAAMSSSIG